jgi:hypothetical protein
MPDETLSEALAEARRLLRPPPSRRDSPWPTLAAAAFFAITALTFAAASILAPPVQSPVPPATILRGVN